MEEVCFYEESVGSSSSSFTMYMREVNSIDLMNIEEEKEIAKQLKNSKTKDEAKRKLIESNLRLVVKIAHGFKGIGLSLEDLVQEGNLGLIRSVETFDVDKNVKFSTYASNWIKNFMSRAISNKGRMIRVPIITEQKRRKLKRFIEDEKGKGNHIDNDLLKEKFGLSDLELKNQTKESDVIISLNAKFDESSSESDEIGELIGDDTVTSSLDDMIYKEDIRCLYKILNKLTEKENTILRMRYGLNEDNRVYTLNEVAKVIGKTYERVRQLENEAVLHMKSMMLQELNK